MARRAWAGGIWLDLAEPLITANTTRCHASIDPVATRTANSRLWDRFKL